MVLCRYISKLKMIDITTSKSIFAYREIQLMVIIYRYLNGNFVVAMYLATGIVSEILAIYNCIALDLPKQMFVFSLWAAIVNASNFVFGFGCLANVFKASFEFKEKIVRNKELLKSKWFRRYIQSFQVLKISYGSGNFLEPMTPLVSQIFVCNQTVSLLLLDK